jgi:protoheme IX farnesyltransferase
MLPVVAGRAETRRQILLYSIVLAPLGASPWLLGYAGLLYGAVSMIGGVAMIALAGRIVTLGDGEGGLPAAKRLFAVSILYLFALFAVLLLDSELGAPGRLVL